LKKYGIIISPFSKVPFYFMNTQVLSLLSQALMKFT
jgi:hypothetical protein